MDYWELKSCQCGAQLGNFGLVALPEKTETSPRVKQVSPWYYHKQISLRNAGSFPFPWIPIPSAGGRVLGVVAEGQAPRATVLP